MRNNNPFYETQIISMEAHITKLEAQREDCKTAGWSDLVRPAVIDGFNQMIADAEKWVRFLESKII